MDLYSILFGLLLGFLASSCYYEWRATKLLAYLDPLTQHLQAWAKTTGLDQHVQSLADQGLLDDDTEWLRLPDEPAGTSWSSRVWLGE